MQEIIVAFTGLDSTAFIVTFAFILLDIITGYCQAIANHTVESKKMKTGFWRKLAIVLTIIAVSLVDVATEVEIDLGFNAPIFEVVCLYVVIMELTSIMENVEKMNPDLANSKIFKILASVTEKKSE